MKFPPVLLLADGHSRPVMPANGTNFTLAECYQLIGCDMIEVTDLRDGSILILDEEGKLQAGAVPNEAATRLFCNVYGRGSDVIVGNVIHCEGGFLR